MATTLQISMADDTDLIIIRDFAAPQGLLWRALTDPTILQRWQWAEDWTGGETTVTRTLTEIAPGATRLKMAIRYSSASARGSAADSGMVPGMEDPYAKLDAILSDGLP